MRGVEFDRRAFAEKAKMLAEQCVKNGFNGIEVLNHMKVGQLCAYYDGIGPNWSAEVILGIVEHIDMIFEPAAFLLDVQYHACKDRSVESFYRCNRQFYENCIKTIKHEYGWWRIKRYRLMKSAKILYDACDGHGMESWNSHARH